MSRSLAVYALLLQLYPRPFLRRHRAEMLQNLQDLEQASTSTADLWLFLVRDLVVGLRSQLTRSLWGQTSIVILALAILLVRTERHAVARLHPVEGLCFGYILGWFAGWLGGRWQASSVSRTPGYIRSLPAQAIIAATVLALVVALVGFVSGAQNHVLWALCYGFVLAWVAGWVGNRWQRRL